MSAECEAYGVRVVVDQSGGADGAPVVFVDTNDELESPLGPAIRILLNDEPVWQGKAYEPRGD